MKKKAAKIILLILALVIVAAGTYICIVNSRYEYEAAGKFEGLSKGETGILHINYDGADGMPESEDIEYEAFKPVTLPKVSKEGYSFNGWLVNRSCVEDTVVIGTRDASARPFFEKDYSNVKSAAALYGEEFSFDEYDIGEYENVNMEVNDVYLDGGYKMYIYQKENFKGKETVVAYTGNYAGYIGSMKITAVESEGVRVNKGDDEAKAMLLQKYAPRIWWDKDEKYFASSVEYAFENLSRVKGRNGYMLIDEKVNKPTYFTPYFYGDMENAKAYAFAVEKEKKYLDLSYFVFTPYNKAKEVFGFQFGNHIGDWEHVTVRLMKYEENGDTYFKPVIVNYSAHSFRNYYAWDDIEKIDGTHMVVYTAQGSHGMWKEPGKHVYVNAVVVKLTDICSQGTSWDLWEKGNMETYSYDAIKKAGKGIGDSEWNTCFDSDYLNDNSNSVTNWGNRGWSPKYKIYASLQGGPGGPQNKAVLNNYYTLSDKQR